MTSAEHKTSSAQLQGLLIVDKPGLQELQSTAPDESATRQPRLPTSHDIVNRVRRWSGEKRIGHTGTLDPMASGVLVLTIGNVTRLTEYHQGHDKRYLAEIRLGEATDSYDCTGEVTETAPIPTLTRSQIESALDQFRGDVWQTPPAFSAIKQDGKTAYQQARKGKELELAARPVTFYQIELLDFMSPATLRLNIHCSTGTYIRSLAHDLGKALGTVATLSDLRRTAVGPFTIENSHSLTEIETKALAGDLHQWLLSPSFGLLLPAVQLDETATRRLGFGQQVKVPVAAFSHLSALDAEMPTKGTLAQAIDPNGELAGIVCCTNFADDGQIVWRADKWFVDSQLRNN